MTPCLACKYHGNVLLFILITLEKDSHVSPRTSTLGRISKIINYDVEYRSSLLSLAQKSIDNKQVSIILFREYVCIIV